MKPPLDQALEGFDNVNRYWDRSKDKYVAKILPGEFYVTNSNELIGTTLGSCVSACIWDKISGIGGMNHFMLPLTEQEIDNIKWGNSETDATRYGNYAMEFLINEILKNGGTRKNMAVKLFGGGKVLKNAGDIGKRNIEFVMDYIKIEKMTLESYDLGDVYPRKVIFDPKSGKAQMKRLVVLGNETIAAREKNYQKTIIEKPVEGDVDLF